MEKSVSPVPTTCCSATGAFGLAATLVESDEVTLAESGATTLLFTGVVLLVLFTGGVFGVLLGVLLTPTVLFTATVVLDGGGGVTTGTSYGSLVRIGTFDFPFSMIF